MPSLTLTRSLMSCSAFEPESSLLCHSTGHCQKLEETLHGLAVSNTDHNKCLILLGYRIYSPWIQIIGKRSPAAPILQMQFEHDGDLLTSVKAEVRPQQSQTAKTALRILTAAAPG